MQEIHTPKPGEGASLSRRTFITIAAAGSAATIPAVALVEAGGTALRSPRRAEPLPLEEQLDACVADLRAILTKMHPRAKAHPHFLRSSLDGSFNFSLQGDVPFEEFDGAGVYEISIEGYPQLYYLEKDYERNRLTGEPIPTMPFYWSAPWDEGLLWDEMRRMWSPRIIRKLPEVVV